MAIEQLQRQFTDRHVFKFIVINIFHKIEIVNMLSTQEKARIKQCHVLITWNPKKTEESRGKLSRKCMGTDTPRKIAYGFKTTYAINFLALNLCSHILLL